MPSIGRHGLGSLNTFRGRSRSRHFATLSSSAQHVHGWPERTFRAGCASNSAAPKDLPRPNVNTDPLPPFSVPAWRWWRWWRRSGKSRAKIRVENRTECRMTLLAVRGHRPDTLLTHARRYAITLACSSAPEQWNVRDRGQSVQLALQVPLLTRLSVAWGWRRESSEEEAWNV